MQLSTFHIQYGSALLPMTFISSPGTTVSRQYHPIDRGKIADRYLE